MSEKYPLEAALTLRERELDEASLRLVEANQLLSQREDTLNQAAAALEAKEVHLTAARAESAARGTRRADEWQRTLAYDARLRSERERADTRKQEAASQLEDARSALEASRDALGEARAALEAVKKHHAQWLQQKRLEQERAEESEADDLVSSRSR